MSSSGFLTVIDTSSMKVSIPIKSHFSVGTSPYYAHQHGLAIDVYQGLTLDNYEALSPISGEILQIKPMAAPKPKFKDGTDKEYLVLVTNPHNPRTVYKILHVKPSVEIGEKISVGDVIGKTIRNGYFAYWSSPHLHLELKSLKDAQRAKGGKAFSLAFNQSNYNILSKRTEHDEIIPIRIKHACQEFMLAQFPENLYHYMEPFYGVKGEYNAQDCIIEGGIPIYKNGMAFFEQELLSFPETDFLLNNRKIGTLRGAYKNFGSIKFDKVVFLLNGKKIRGISLFMAGFMPLVKIIPQNRGEFSFDLNSVQNLIIL